MTAGSPAPEACSSCSAMFWKLKYVNSGRPNPIDCAPVRGGNIRIDLREGTYSIIPKAQLDPNAMGYVSHFATCPNAPQYRKRKQL